LETEYDAKPEQSTINTISNHHKNETQGEICIKPMGDCPNQVNSDQMVLRTFRQGGWTV
jgi:hypothetical protein